MIRVTLATSILMVIRFAPVLSVVRITPVIVVSLMLVGLSELLVLLLQSGCQSFITIIVIRVSLGDFIVIRVTWVIRIVMVIMVV